MVSGLEADGTAEAHRLDEQHVAFESIKNLQRNLGQCVLGALRRHRLELTLLTLPLSLAGYAFLRIVRELLPARIRELVDFLPPDALPQCPCVL
jgi:hypothetical protein